MRPKAFSLALMLTLSGGPMLSPDYAYSGGGMGPAAPATSARPPVVVTPKSPPSTAVPSRNAVVRAQLIAQVKTKYAQQKNFVTNKYIQERGKIFSSLNRLQSIRKTDPFTYDQYALPLVFQLKALETAYHETIRNLDQRRDAELQGVYGAKDLLR